MYCVEVFDFGNNGMTRTLNESNILSLISEKLNKAQYKSQH